MALNWVQFFPQRSFGNVWRQFSLSQKSEVGATSMQCVETKDAKEDVLYTFPKAFLLPFVILDAINTIQRRKKKESERETEKKRRKEI